MDEPTSSLDVSSRDSFIELIRKLNRELGIAFLIIRFNIINKTYLLEGEKLLDFLSNTDRKSIPLDFFENNCKLIELKYRPRLDYLKSIDI